MIETLLYFPHSSSIMVPNEHYEGVLEAYQIINEIFQLKNQVNL